MSRHRDPVGVTEQHGDSILHIFNDEALNTFDPDLARERDGVGGYRLVERRRVPTQTLTALLERFFGR